MEEQILTLANNIAQFIAPFTPLLIEAGTFSRDAIAELIVQNGGQAIYERVQGLWSRIRGTTEQDQLSIEGAATLLSVDPQNERNLVIFRDVLIDVLRNSPSLLRELDSEIDMLRTEMSVIADKSSWIENVSQESSGTTRQTVQASDDSVIKDVRQISK